jgi:predicted MFS family arabinose efflux permease
MLSYYLGNSFLTFFIASLLLALFSTPLVPLCDAVVLRSAHKNQFDFSKIRLGGTIGYAIVVNISGAIVKIRPELLFVLGSISYLLLLFFIRLLPKSESDEEKQVKITSLAKPSLKERFNLLRIFESKQIFFILAFAFINQVGLSFNYTFLGVYMVKLGLNEEMIGFINCVSAFSEIPVLLFINRALRKNSAMKLTILGCILLGIRIATVTGENIGFIILSQALHGLTFMTIYYSCAIYISKNVKPENQSQGQSILAIVQGGIGSFVGNIVGGYLVDLLGLKSAYLIMAAVILGVTVFIIAIQALLQKALSPKV